MTRKRLSVQKRKRQKNYNANQRAQAAMLYAEGLSLREVAERFGVSKPTVWYWLCYDLGLELRPWKKQRNDEKGREGFGKSQDGSEVKESRRKRPDAGNS